MKTEQVTFRPIERGDYESLEKIISATWAYEKMSSPATAKAIARIYLRSCLAEQNFNRVALYQGQAIGIIMAKSKKGPKVPLGMIFDVLVAAWPLLISKEGRKMGKMYAALDRLNQDLLRETGQAFDGELVFFAVAESARGLGLGKQLFGLAKDYLLAEGVKQFYLFTDTTCNYLFYDSQGLVRMGEKQMNLYPGREASFFIYRYDFATISQSP